MYYAITDFTALSCDLPVDGKTMWRMNPVRWEMQYFVSESWSIFLDTPMPVSYYFPKSEVLFVNKDIHEQMASAFNQSK